MGPRGHAGKRWLRVGPLSPAPAGWGVSAGKGATLSAATMGSSPGNGLCRDREGGASPCPRGGPEADCMGKPRAC